MHGSCSNILLSLVCREYTEACSNWVTEEKYIEKQVTNVGSRFRENSIKCWNIQGS